MSEVSSHHVSSPGGPPVQTHLPPPANRTFFKQSRSEKIMGILWAITMKTLFRWSFHKAHRWRIFLLRLFGAEVAGSVRIHRTVSIRVPRHLTIGENSLIGERTILNCLGRVTIGQRVLIDRYSHLCAASHDYSRPDMLLLQTPITLGDDVKLSTDVFVGPNVSIGENTTVGPRSSVVKNLPPNINAQGEPAAETDHINKMS